MAATSAEDLNQIIANNLRELRRRRGVTLDEVAETTGVSKSMLGQIERGECGLSVATLWKISTGLKISFTALMSDERPKVQLVENTSLVPLGSDKPGFRLYPVFPAETDRSFDILYIELEPGAQSMSEAHEQGTEEFTLVCEGTLWLTAGNEGYTVPAGYSVRYGGDQIHGYANHGSQTTRLYMVIQYTK